MLLAFVKVVCVLQHRRLANNFFDAVQRGGAGCDDEDGSANGKGGTADPVAAAAALAAVLARRPGTAPATVLTRPPRHPAGALEGTLAVAPKTEE